MDKKLKTRWVKALRSGRYKQGSGQLRRGDGTYCCLGVLCVVSRAKLDSDGATATYKGKSNLHGGDFLPASFGISPAKLASLVTLNDRRRATFEQIASYIEKNVKAHD